MDGIHVTTRTLHYLELRRAIDRLGPAKLSAGERELLLDASDAALFGEPEADPKVAEALDLCQALAESGRLSETTALALYELVCGCAEPALAATG
jgi:hypothetical protein